MRELIRKLCECDGPPGHEGPVRERVLAEIKGLADQVAVSPLGSIHATLNPSGDCKIMVAAHMDELGLIISHVDPRGYARFQSLGRIVPEALPGQRIRFSNGAIGVVGTSGLQGKPKPLRLDDLFLDFGAASQRACPVQVGDCGAFVHEPVDFGSRLMGKAMNNRVGVAILIGALKRLRTTANQVQLAFTVQEEVGGRGATTSAFALDPDVALVVDVAGCDDLPRNGNPRLHLGGGPALSLRGRRTIADPRVVGWIEKAASKAGIPCQREVLERGPSEGTPIHHARAGIPSGGLLVPCRHLHTSSEMVDLDDVLATSRLLVALLRARIDLK